MKKKKIFTFLAIAVFITILSSTSTKINAAVNNDIYVENKETIDAIFTEDNGSVSLYTKTGKEVTSEFKQKFNVQYEKGNYQLIFKEMQMEEYAVIIIPSELEKSQNCRAFPYDRMNSYYWEQNTSTNGSFKFQLSATIQSSVSIGTGKVTGYDNNLSVKQISGSKTTYGIDWNYHVKPRLTFLSDGVEYIDRAYFRTSSGYYYYNPLKIRLTVLTSYDQPKPVILGSY